MGETDNGGKHARKIEDGVSSLQLFSCNHEADIKIALIQSKCCGRFERH